MYLGIRAIIERTKQYTLWFVAVLVFAFIAISMLLYFHNQQLEGAKERAALERTITSQQAALQKQQLLIEQDQQKINTQDSVIGTINKKLQDLQKKLNNANEIVKQVQGSSKDSYSSLSSRSSGYEPGISFGNWESYTATWYSPAGGSGSGTITATGAPVKDGWTVAVDPNVIPLGSLVEIRFQDGTTHIYKAEDTGSAIVGHRLDIYSSSEMYCERHGVQNVEVRVITSRR